MTRSMHLLDPWFSLAAMAMGFISATAALAGRPLATNDAQPIPLHAFQIEAGAALARGEHVEHLDAPILTLGYGVIENLEVGIGGGAQFEWANDADGHAGTTFERSLADLGIGFKWKYLDQQRALVDQALAGSIKIPTADDHNGLGSGHVDYDLTWIGQRALTEQFDLLLNVGYTLIGRSDDDDDDPTSDVAHAGLALQHQLAERWQPVAEILVDAPTQHGRPAWGTSVGIRYAATPSLVLDAAVGTKLAGNWPDLTATVGLTWVF